MSWLTSEDPYLEPYDGVLRARHEAVASLRKRITESEGSLEAFARSHERMGAHRQEGTEGEEGIVLVREWLPGALAVFIFGDFNSWRRQEYPLRRLEYGVWEARLPGHVLQHGMRVKLGIATATEGLVERVPAWARFCQASPSGSHLDGVFWEPPPADMHVWKHSGPGWSARERPLKIYEAHVGMGGEEPRVHSYDEFTETVLPHIAAMGFNAVQLMGVMEHSYYASFGYQVTSFFAPASRSGPPEALKRLVDTAHGLGLAVLLDLVHSHASANVLDGLNSHDGSSSGFFHDETGPRGRHPQWDSRLFDYGQWETLRFLLSNVDFWLREYHFDGMRLDGVTSMLYRHHGIGHSFVRGYPEYFEDDAVDGDALVYLSLCCEVAHAQGAVVLAEEVSGYPGLARPWTEGGVGCDYRLHMGPADEWIRLLEDEKDEQWSVGRLVRGLMDRRKGERHVGYVESHDQALVGDKTLLMRLANEELYSHMSIVSPASLKVDRAVALHKLASGMTWVLGGDALLVFMGNEWGHPEWIDFPRQGNQQSYQWARRQWSLAHDSELRYSQLLAWSKAVLDSERHSHWLSAPAHVTQVDEEKQTAAVERPMGELLWLFNMGPHSHAHLELPGPPVRWRVILSSDDLVFGGHARVQHGGPPYVGGGLIYLPSRTCILLERVKE